MKKITRILALSFVCILSVTLFAACGNTPNTDIDSAAANLRKNGYSVTATKQESIGAPTVFASTAALVQCDVADIEATLQAYNDNGMDNLRIVWFVSTEAAEATRATMQASNDKSQEDIEKLIADVKSQLASASDDARAELENQLNAYETQLELISNRVIGTSGNVFYMGSKAAIKATK